MWHSLEPNFFVKFGAAVSSLIAHISSDSCLILLDVKFYKRDQKNIRYSTNALAKLSGKEKDVVSCSYLYLLLVFH